jgi:hypothetical protein
VIISQEHKGLEDSSSKAVESLQQYTLALWAARNDILHDSEEETAAIVHVRINSEIKQLYLDKKHFSQSDQAYFTIPMESILKLNIRGRRRWLYLARLVSSRARERVNIGQQLVPTYFFPKPNPTSTTSSTTPQDETPYISYLQTSLTQYYDRPMLTTISESDD